MAYKSSDAIEAFIETGLATEIFDSSKSLDQLAAACGLEPVALSVFLKFLSGIGLVETPDSEFQLSDAGKELLPFLELERRTRAWHSKNGSLVKVLKGEDAQDPMNSADALDIRMYYDRAMGSSKRVVALEISTLPECKSRGHLLDLGGGDGSLALELCRKIGLTSAVVVDRPSVEQAFEVKAASVENNIREKVAFFGADLRVPETLLPKIAAADLFVLSNIVHLLDKDLRCEIWRLLANGAKHGSSIVVYDQFPGSNTASSDLMVLDWIMCGSLFDLTVTEQMEEIAECGLTPNYSKKGRMVAGSLIVATKL